jgi:hypothetical protein
MGGHGSHPLGWAALALVVVAYAHVILELAAAALALAIAVRIMSAAPWQVVVEWVMSRHRRRGRDAVSARRAMAEAPASRRDVDQSGTED